MGTDVDLYIGKKIFQRRKLMGLTQKALGEKIGVRFQQIHRYEIGENRITANTIFELCKVMKVEPNYFYDGLMLNGKILADNVNVLVVTGETRQLIRTYYRMNAYSRRRMLETMEELAPEVPISDTQEAKPVLQLVQKAG